MSLEINPHFAARRWPTDRLLESVLSSDPATAEASLDQLQVRAGTLMREDREHAFNLAQRLAQTSEPININLRAAAHELVEHYNRVIEEIGSVAPVLTVAVLQHEDESGLESLSGVITREEFKEDLIGDTHSSVAGSKDDSPKIFSQDERLQSLIDTLLSERHRDRAMTQIKILRQFPDSSVLRAFETIIQNDRCTDVRAEAALAIGSLPLEEASTSAKNIVTGTNQTSPWIKIAAITGLGFSSYPSAKMALLELSQSTSLIGLYRERAQQVLLRQNIIDDVEKIFHSF